MKMIRVIGVILICTSLLAGYMGINKISESTAKVEVFDVELSASDESGKQTGYIYLGIGALLFLGGLYAVTRK